MAGLPGDVHARLAKPSPRHAKREPAAPVADRYAGSRALAMGKRVWVSRARRWPQGVVRTLVLVARRAAVRSADWRLTVSPIVAAERSDLRACLIDVGHRPLVHVSTPLVGPRRSLR
jgi:hypothetical protein